MFTVALSWAPSVIMVATRLNRYAGSLRSWKEPFDRSIRQVIGPSFNRNFDVGGRPPWAPLDDKTVHIRGSAEPILVVTGRLKRAAQQLNIWTIDGPGGEAYLDMSALPVGAWYGILHQQGTRHMPARPWAVLQEEDADKIAEVFADFLADRGVDAGLTVRRV